MTDFAHNLLLLMLSLSQLNSREKILAWFIDALGSLLPGLEIGLFQPDGLPPLECVEISTLQNTFGRLEVRGPAEAYPPHLAAQVRNAARMAAIILENRMQAELLANDNLRLEAAVQERIIELERVAVDLQAEIKRRQASEARYRDLVDALPQSIYQVDRDGRMLFANRAHLSELNLTLEQALGKTAHDFYPGNLTKQYHQDDLFVMQSGEILTRVEEHLHPASGEMLNVEVVKIPLRDTTGEVCGIQGIYWDVSQRVRYEQTLRASEEKYRRLFDEQLDAIFLADPETGILLDANKAALQLTGWSREELIGQPQAILHPPEELQGQFTRTFWQHRQGGDGEMIETSILTRADETRQVTIKGTRLELGGRVVLLGIFRDITAEKRAQLALQTSERRFRAIFNESPIGMALYTAGDILLEFNPAYQRIMGIPEEHLPQVIGQPRLFSRTEDARRKLAQGENVLVETRMNFDEFTEMGFFTPNRRGVCHLEITTAPIHRDGEHINNLTLVQDVTARRLAEEALEHSYTELQVQNQRLSVLHNIDLAITSHSGLKELLKVILENTIRLDGIDAALLLLPDESQPGLGLAEQSGLDASRRALKQVRWMQTPAAQVFSGRRSVFGGPESIPGPLQQQYGGVGWLPLVVEDQPRGVLAVFRRDILPFEQGLAGFLEALALQTAIALDNTGLFYRLQASNFELTEAYGATLEGWAKTLELRDKETRGHSDRVANLTEKLARRMGIQDDELTHIRRGVLLHDIGKVGIPDAILHKPGPLTPDEWVIMRQHPRYAYDLLAGIAFLRPALDIPYGHHEKWDGSGYPRHLKGEEIPLAARLFAIVDVWDALNSDRPYRPAWPREETLAYLRDQAGRHFDPDVVNVFLELLAETGDGQA